jgi:Flp pilus assembly protein TadG
MRLRRQDGASAVEFALIAPLLFMLVFGIIGFGLAFLQVQSIRAAVREGGRAAATGTSASGTQQRVLDAAVGYIPSAQKTNIIVSPSGSSTTAPCNPSNIGDDVMVSYDTTNLPGGGVVVHIPVMPDIVIHPVITASFRCEV